MVYSLLGIIKDEIHEIDEEAKKIKNDYSK